MTTQRRVGRIQAKTGSVTARYPVKCNPAALRKYFSDLKGGKALLTFTVEKADGVKTVGTAAIESAQLCAALDAPVDGTYARLHSRATRGYC